MSIVTIETVGASTLERAIKVLAGIPNGAQRAIRAAATRAGEMGKSKAGQFAAAEYTISKGTFMARTTQKTRVTGGSGGVVVNISFAGGVIPLLEFNTRYSRGGKMTTTVKRSSGAATLDHVFVANIGGIGAFERVGAARFPLEGKYGPSTGHMMQDENVIEQMDKTISEAYEKRMDHEITRLLNGWGG